MKIYGKSKAIFALFLLIALTALFSGCSSSSKPNTNTATPDVNRATPTTAATATPAPSASEVLLGVWETRDPRFVNPYKTATGTSSDFVRMKMNYAKEDKGIYTGDVTDVTTNKNLGTYTLYPNKSIKFDFPTISALSNTHDYEISGDTNTLSLKTDSSPIIFKKGTANTDVEKDARILSSAGALWEPTPSTKTSIDNRIKYTVMNISFDPPTQSGEGYGGRMDLNLDPPPGVKDGTYIVAPNKKIILTIDGGRTEANYSIETNGDVLKLKFADGDEWVFNKK